MVNIKTGIVFITIKVDGCFLKFIISGQMPLPLLENVKKCKNFLSTLIKLASSQPPETVRNVRDLIQGLIVSTLEYFTFLSSFF